MPPRGNLRPRDSKTGRFAARDPPPTGWQSKKIRSANRVLESKLAASRGSGNEHLDGLAGAALQPAPEFLADNTQKAGELAVPEPENSAASHPQPSAAATGTKLSSLPALEEPGVSARQPVPAVGDATERKHYHRMLKEFGQITLVGDSSVPDMERDKGNSLDKIRQEQQPAPAAAPSTRRTRSANRRGASGSQLPRPGNAQPASSEMPRPNPQRASSEMPRPDPQPASSAMPRPNPQPAPNPSLPSIAPDASGTGRISNVNTCPVCGHRTVTRLPDRPPAGNNGGAPAGRSRISRSPCQFHFPVLAVTGLQERMDDYFAANPVSQMTPEEVCEFFTTGTSSTNPALNALGLGEPW